MKQIAVCAFLLLASCTPKIPKTVYLALETHTQEQKELNQDISHDLARQMHSGDTVIVDQMVGDKVVNLVSNNHPSRVLREIEGTVSVAPSTDLAVIEAVKRASIISSKTGQEVRCVIVTDGIKDEASVNGLADALLKLPPGVSVSVVGIDSENRLPMSQAFAALPGQVKFGSLDSEWKDMIHRATE